VTGPPARVACAYLPHVAAAIEMRDDPTLACRPFVVVAAGPGPERVGDMSYLAHQLGVRPGMTVARAREMAPGLAVRPPREEDRLAAFRAMLEALASFTPAVEPADLAHGWLSVARAIGRGESERALAGEVAARVGSATGVGARLGLAHGKLTSRIVTRYLQEQAVMVLPPGKEAPFLGGLAVGYLPLPAGTVERLRQLGVTKVHQYAALPAAGILPRYGYAGLRAYELAHGQDDAQVRAWTAEPMVEAAHVFAEPIGSPRNLHFRIEDLARQVAGPLARDYRMAGELSIDLAFESGEVVTKRRVLVEPVGGAGGIIDHAKALVADVRWPGPMARVALGVRGLCRAPARQLALFRQERQDGDAVAQTLERIQARFGEGAVRQGRRQAPGSPLHERRATLAPWRAAR